MFSRLLNLSNPTIAKIIKLYSLIMLMGFFESINDTLQLLKNTFVVMGRNPAIMKPTLIQILLGSIFYLFVIGSLVVTLYSSGTIKLIAISVFIFSLMLLLPLFPFIKMYYRAAQSWIVYNVFIGKKVSYEDGLKRANQNKGDIFVLGVFDILFSALTKRLKAGTGRGGLWVLVNIVMWIIGKAIEEGWDLLGHYLLPATIIEEKNVGEVLPRINDIRKNVPGALAGTFAIDFAGDAVAGYITAFMILFLIVGVIVGILYNTWLPAIIIFVLIIGINFIIKILIDMVKTVYFTLFYMSITMPKRIVLQYRKEVTHYLLNS